MKGSAGCCNHECNARKVMPGSRELNTTLYISCLVVLRVDHLPYAFFRSVNTGIVHDTGITKSGVT